MSRPPIAHDEGEPRIAMLDVYETQRLEFLSDSDKERVTYATDSAQSPQLRGGSDSGKSVPEKPACKMCQRPDRADVMLVCEGCNLGFHTDCLKPPLKKVPSGDFICDDHPQAALPR